MNTLYTKEGENPSLGQKFVDNEKTISNNVTIVTKNITLKGLIIIQSARLPAFVLFLSNTYTKSLSSLVTDSYVHCRRQSWKRVLKVETFV